MLQVIQQNDSLNLQLQTQDGVTPSPTLNIPKKQIDPAKIEMVDSISRAEQSNSLNANQTNEDIVKTSTLKTKRETFVISPMSSISYTQVELLNTHYERPSINLPEKKLSNSNPEWVVGIFLLILILFASIRLFFDKFLGQLLHSTVSYGASVRMFRERSLNFSSASISLDIIFYLMLSMFIYQSLDFLNVRWVLPEIFKYLIILAGVFLFFNVKKLSYIFQGGLTESIPETQEFIFNLNLYNRTVGLILLPICLIIEFSPIANPHFIMILAGILIGFVYILLILRGFRILLKKQFSIFYLILYLCTLEILPLIFIYNLVLK